MSDAWSEARIGRFEILVAEGKSHSEIAAIMKVSKSNISQRMLKHGHRRSSPIPIAPKPAPPPVPKYVSTMPPYQPPQTFASPTCCFPLWPHGAVPTQKFCDAVSVLGQSWCPEHLRVVTLKVSAR